MDTTLIESEILPQNCDSAVLVGRVWSNERKGPCPILVDNNLLHDLTSFSPTLAGLLEITDLNQVLSNASDTPILGQLDEFLPNRDGKGSAGYLLAPCDLQPIKAAGVTFVDSILERLIEEECKGDSRKSKIIRARLTSIVGENVRGVKPASEKAASIKTLLQEQGLWSQYLEVGIGPHAEIFSKAPPMASVGLGHEIGIRSDSDWNNPEPEIVLAISSKGNIVGATLGNDVNLRDFEGRSALLLNIAKDNNASCSIGPFIRLFDPKFGLDDVVNMQIKLCVIGDDGYEVVGINKMSKISRNPQDLVAQLLNQNHQYPDGVMLFLGTMFVPTKDRDGPNSGFTHKIGDRVQVSAPELGCLTNWVNYCENIPPWNYGLRSLFEHLAHSYQAKR